jgi:uroporphyrinogen-III synthase
MKKTLYLGLEISKRWRQENLGAEIIHFPIIKIEERSLNESEITKAFSQFERYTHIILTSRVSVMLFFKTLLHFGIPKKALAAKKIIVVGKSTAEVVGEFGADVAYCATNETSEGIVERLKSLNLSEAHFLWPCSALSREVIPNFLKQSGIAFCQVALYTTLTNISKEFPEADELVFTSPSTVDAFLENFKTIPWDKKITAIGPITEARLQKAKEEQIL